MLMERDAPEHMAWLSHAKDMMAGADLAWFLAIQYDPGDDHNYWDARAVAERMEEDVGVPLDFQRFAIEGHRWTTRERLIGITMGRNLVREHALRDTDATHVLFLDTDIEPDPECIPKLLEVDHPVAGGEIPSYCLSGLTVFCSGGPSHLHSADVDGAKDDYCKHFSFPTEEHWDTAGFLLVRRDVLSQVAWRWNPDDDMTDDPCFAQDVERAGFGKTWVRKDCIGQHRPPILVPVEAR
jgi:hypothetical protein